MIRLQLALLLLIGATNCLPWSHEGRIVGGKPVDIEDFPYQASLQYGDLHMCGASILSKKFLLTAAHCTNGAKPDKLTVRVGSAKRENGGTVTPVKKVYEHQYNESTIDYDLAILELAEELVFSATVQPIDLIGPNEATKPGSLAVVSGWGLLKEAGSIAFDLQAVEVPVVDHSKCQEVYKDLIQVTARMMCTGFEEGGKSPCQQDSGGPLVYNGKQIGVVSWSSGCARPGYPNVYTDVAAVRDFIAKVTGL